MLYLYKQSVFGTPLYEGLFRNISILQMFIVCFIDYLISLRSYWVHGMAYLVVLGTWDGLFSDFK